MKKIVDIKTAKFLLVGVLNTAVGSFIMFFLYNIVKTNYWFASFSNYIIGSVISFYLNKHFTFHSNSKSLKEIVNFIINIFICYVIAYGVAKPLVFTLISNATLKIQENIAMLVGMIIFVVLNYLGQRFIVFKEVR